MRTSREMFDMVLNGQNTARLEDIEALFDQVREMAGKLMPMSIPKSYHGASGMGQIQRAIHKLLEAKVEFQAIRERILEGLDND